MRLAYVLLSHWLKFIATSDVGIISFQSILGGPPSGIPTRQEQADLLSGVEELFKQVKLLVEDEGKQTDKSVISDLGKTVVREKDKLALVEELALLSKQLFIDTF